MAVLTSMSDCCIKRQSLGGQCPAEATRTKQWARNSRSRAITMILWLADETEMQRPGIHPHGTQGTPSASLKDEGHHTEVHLCIIISSRLYRSFLVMPPIAHSPIDWLRTTSMNQAHDSKERIQKWLPLIYENSPFFPFFFPFFKYSRPHA